MQLALTVGGAYLGSLIPGLPPNIGQALGATAGSMAGAYFFGPELPDIQGPRLEDLKVQVSTNGMPIPIVYGAYRLAGNVIYSTEIQETRKDEEVGGKGGGVTQTTYSYSVSLAVGICEGPVDGIRRIWANGKLIYNADTGLRDTDIGDMRIYLGTEDQNPDPFWQGVYGMDNTPAHRGLVYVTLDNLQLATFGNRIPNFSFEVYPAGSFWISKIEKESAYILLYATTSYNGDIYSFGDFSYGELFGYLLVKQDKSGQILALKQINVDNVSNYPNFIEVKNGYIYLYDYKNIIKLDLSFNVIYSKYIDDINSVPMSIVDNEDNFYLFYWVNGHGLIKLNSIGEVVYNKSYSIEELGEKGYLTRPQAIQFLSDGSFVALLEIGVLLKFSSNGDLLRLINLDTRQGFDVPFRFYSEFGCLRVDDNNNIYVSGVSPITPPEPLSFDYKDYYAGITKLDSDFNVLWSRHFDSSFAYNNDTNYFVSITIELTIDQNNNVYVFMQTGPESNKYLIKYDTNGNVIWGKNFISLFEYAYGFNTFSYFKKNVVSSGSNLILTGHDYIGFVSAYGVVAKLPQLNFGEKSFDSFSYENVNINTFNNVSLTFNPEEYPFESVEDELNIFDTEITISTLENDFFENNIYQV